MSARDRLLKRRPRKVTIDGDDFYVRSLTLREAAKVDAFPHTASGAIGIEGISYLLATCLTDEDGKPIFDGPEDDSIQDIPGDTLSRLTKEIEKLSGAGKAHEKNSVATP